MNFSERIAYHAEKVGGCDVCEYKQKLEGIQNIIEKVKRDNSAKNSYAYVYIEEMNELLNPEPPWIKLVTPHDIVYWGKEEAIERAKKKWEEQQNEGS